MARVFQPVYEWLAWELKHLGVNKVFGLMSEDTALLAATLDAIGIRFYSARHENNAIAMAEGYSSVSGALSVALIGRGPATANGLHAGTYASRTDSKVLILMGDAPVAVDINESGPDTKWFRSVDVLRSAGLTVFRPHNSELIKPVLYSAVKYAMRGSAVALLLPTDIQQMQCEIATNRCEESMGNMEYIAEKVIPSRSWALDQAAKILSAAKRPIILAGKGAWLAGAYRSLLELGDKTGSVFCTTLKAKDMFADHPFHVGMVGSFSLGLGRRFFDETDCIVAFGASLNKRTTSLGTAFSQTVPLIQVDSSREQIGRWHPADLAIVGDADLVAKELISRLPPDRDQVGFRTKCNQDFIHSFDRSSEFVPIESSRTLDPRSLGLALNEILPKHRHVVYDAGNFLGILPYIDVPSPAHLKNTSEFGSIGLGLATAIGVAEANLRHPTYLFIGDGGLLMALGELETLAREDIQLCIFIMNDCAYGAETHYLHHHDLSVSKTIFTDIDFGSLVDHLGIQSVTLRSLSDLEKVSTLVSKVAGPIVVDCKINGKVAAGFTSELG